MTLTRLIRRVVAPALFCATLVPLLGSLGLLRRTVVVDPGRIQFQSGLAYSIEAPESTWLWRVPADTPEAPETSGLALYLDGKPLGPPHSLHDDIGRKGAGSYSHWQDYVLFSMPDASDPRRGRGRLTVRFGPTLNPAIALLLSMVLGWLAVRALCFRNDRWQRLRDSAFWKRLAMRFAGWGALAGALMVGHSLSGAASRWALFTLGCLACLALRRWDGASASLPVSASPRVATLIGLGAGLLSVSTSLIAVAALSTPFNTDAPYYFTRPSEMFSPRGGEVSATTPLFGLIFGFIQLIGLEGAALIGLQIAVRAAAAFAASRLVAGGSLWLGVALGLFLGIDPVGATLATMYATESLHSSSLILAAVAIASLSPIASLPRGISIGVFVGLTGLFRPSGIPLLALAVVFLAWNARASRAFRGALAGVAIAVLLVSSVARLQRGSWHPIGGGGGFAYAWPLLVHQLLDPANGPQSEALTSAVRSCDPRWPKEPIRIETDSNERIPAIKTCLVSSGRPIDEVFQLFAASYREAIVAQPGRFLGSVRDEFLNYLGTTVSHNILLGAQFATEDLSLICEPSAANPLFARAPALRNGEANARVMDTLAFLCPAPRPIPQFGGLAREATTGFRGVFQPYFYALEPPFFRRAVSNVAEPWWMGLCAVSFAALVLGISRGWAFRIAALSVLIVGTAAATVALTHLTTARYLAPFSPWFLALSALLVFAFARDVAESVLEFVRIARSPETPGLHGIVGAPVWKPLWQTKPATLGADLKALRELLTTRRPLLLELTRREILDRHAGQLLGAGWALFQPLLVVGVYLFVFGYIFKGRIGGGAAPGFDYPVFLLAGLIPWLGFQESMSRSSDVIVINANLVKQVVFPIEVLPVRSALAAMFTQSILLLGLLAYVSVRTGSIPWTYLLLPVFLVLQFTAFAGLNYFLAAFGVFFRDTRELVQAFAVMGIYFLPTIYSPESAPAWLLSLLALNPFSHFIWCAQDVLFFGAIHHPWSWLVTSCLSLVVLVTGFRFFRRASTVFGNLL